MMTKLEVARRRRGLRQIDVANAAGCSESMVAYLEQRKRVPSPDLGKRIARAVGLDPARWQTLQKRG